MAPPSCDTKPGVCVAGGEGLAPPHLRHKTTVLRNVSLVYPPSLIMSPLDIPPLYGSRIGGHRATGRARGRSSYDDVVFHPMGCVRSWGHPGPIRRAMAHGWPTMARLGPQAPGPQGPRAALKGPAHQRPGRPVRAEGSPQGPGWAPALEGLAHKGPGRPSYTYLVYSPIIYAHIYIYICIIGFECIFTDMYI